MKTRLLALVLALILLLTPLPVTGATIAIYRDIPADGLLHTFALGDEPPDSFYTYRVRVPKLSEITIEALTAPTTPFNISYGMTHGGESMENGQRINRLRGWANPGDFCFSAWTNGQTGPVDIRVTLVPLNLNLNEPPEPNDGVEAAGLLAEDIVIRGAIAMGDMDTYLLSLPRDCEIELSLTQDRMPLNALIDSPWWSENAQGVNNGNYASNPLDVPKTQTARAVLRSGDHYVDVRNCYADSGNTTYSISYKIIGAPRVTLSCWDIWRSVGERDKLTYFAEPASFNWPAPIVTFKNPKFASYDASTGMVSGNAPGSTTATVTVGDTPCTINVTITKNSYIRKKPAFGKKRGVYVSHKKIYYEGDYLCGETFVYNKTKRTLKGYDMLVGVIFDTSNEGIVASVPIGRWRPKGGIGVGKYKVAKFKIPRNEPNLDMNRVLSLEKQQYIALVVDASQLSPQQLEKGITQDGIVLPELPE